MAVGLAGKARGSPRCEGVEVEYADRSHAPDFFVRRADGTGVLIDVRPDERVSAADSAVFAATAAMARQAGWAYDRPANCPLSARPTCAGLRATAIRGMPVPR